MNQETKAYWLEALRSGEYEQATHELQDVGENAFCCLGVLCDIHGLLDEHGYTFGNYEDDRHHGTLPKSYCKGFGLPYNEMMRLSDLNDSGTDFAEVARYIEKEL